MNKYMRYPALLVAAFLVGFGASVTASEGVNLNSASAEELAALENVGDTRARAIVEYRESNGAFGSVDELVDVSGIGNATLELNRDRIFVEE